MTAKELQNSINYFGQERDLRKLCVDQNLVPIDKLAMMNSNEVYTVVARHYRILGYRDDGETVMLVKNENWDAVQEFISELRR